MSNNSVPVIKFLFSSEWKPLSDALATAPAFEAESIDSASDLTTFLSAAPAGLIVASLKDKNDLIQIATFLKLIKKVAPNSYFKIIVRNSSGDKQFEKAIAKLGILDLVDDRIQTKALRFKIDFLMKSINVHLKRVATANANANSNSVKSLDVAKAQEKKIADNQANWIDPMDCEDDLWLLKTDADCKRVLNRWLVKFMGPSPYVAQWNESGKTGIWKLEFKSETNDFIYGKGIWYFRGEQKPDFVWSENNWLFTGSGFDLFYKEGDAIQSRLKLVDKVLTIAKNSDYAKTKEQSIIESFDKDLVFKKDMASKLEMETTDKELEAYKNLEGKSKTDEISGGPLSGKSKTDEISGGPLSGKSKTDEISGDPLSGKGKTDALKGGPLSGKGKTSDLSSDPLSLDLKPEDNKSGSDPLSQKTGNQHEKSKWKGKNALEQEAGGPLEAPTESQHKSGSQLSLEGKGSHEKFYRNHNETEKFLGKDLGGKSSTDEIEGYLSSPLGLNKKDKDKIDTDNKDKEKKEKQDGSAIEAKDALGGKSSTDKMDGHLRSKNHTGNEDLKKAVEKKNAFQSKEESESNAKADAKQASDIRDKSNTDNLPGYSSSPSKNGATKESKRDERSLAGNTESVMAELDQALDREKKASSAAAGKKSRSETTNVLPFSEKPLVAKDEHSPELTDSMQSAKVTAFLVQDTVKVSCILDDFYDQTIVFMAPPSGITQTKKVSLNMNFNYMNKDTLLKFDGSVLQIEQDGEGSSYITVEISKENASAFNSFMKLYNTRQENINFFLKTVKGI